MADHRTAWEQAKSGFRIGGLIMLAFLFFVALVGGLEFMVGRAEPSRGYHPVLGAAITTTLVSVLFKTTRYWAKWLVGILFLCVFRIFGVLLFKWFYELPTNLSVSQALAWFAYLLAAFALTVRHASRDARGAEKLGLVCFVVCVALAMVRNGYAPLLYGLVLLALSEFLQRLVFHRRHHKSGHPLSPSAIEG